MLVLPTLGSYADFEIFVVALPTLNHTFCGGIADFEFLRGGFADIGIGG